MYFLISPTRFCGKILVFAGFYYKLIKTKGNLMTKRQYSEEEVLAWAKGAHEDDSADFPIVTNKCALVVIDMQDEFVKPHYSPNWVPESTRMIPKVKTLIAKCRELSVPVIFTSFADTHLRYDRPKTVRYMPIGYPKRQFDFTGMFIDGKICDELTPLQDEVVIHKPSYGAFYDRPLDTILKNLGKDTVIISGTLTNFCCGTTARQAYERGYKVVFGSDVNATDFPEMHEAELKVLRKGFAWVLTAGEIIAELERGN
jgi:nicotinamidase-related amidase